MQKIRVLVEDDHTIVRDGICALLNLAADMHVVGEAADGREALDKVRELTPDVVILDIAMPLLGGMEATRRIRKEFPAIKVLALTQYSDKEYVLRVIEAGAHGFVSKTAASSELAIGIRSVYRGDSFLSPSVAKLLVENFPTRSASAKARKYAEDAGVAHLVRFFEQNLFNTDIRQVTVVMLYLYPEVNLRLRPKLLRELKPCTRIASHSHTMGEWEDDATKTVEGHILHFFVIPANATGAWKWIDPDGENISLTLTQKFQRVKGTLSVGTETYPLIGASLWGNRFRFAVERQVRGSWETFLFKGQISRVAITGKMTSGTTAQRVNNWQATRDPSTIAPIAE